MVLVLARGQVRLLLGLKSHYFGVVRRLDMFHLIDHVCKSIRLRLPVLMVHFSLLGELLFRGGSIAIVELFRLEIVLNAERVHLFTWLVEVVKAFAVEEHFVAVAWGV